MYNEKCQICKSIKLGEPVLSKELMHAICWMNPFHSSSFFMTWPQRPRRKRGCNLERGGGNDTKGCFFLNGIKRDGIQPSHTSILIVLWTWKALLGKSECILCQGCAGWFKCTAMNAGPAPKPTSTSISRPDSHEIPVPRTPPGPSTWTQVAHTKWLKNFWTLWKKQQRQSSSQKRSLQIPPPSRVSSPSPSWL